MAIISKNGGGIGIDITDIRLSGNYIKGSGGISSGVGMMLYIFMCYVHNNWDWTMFSPRDAEILLGKNLMVCTVTSLRLKIMERSNGISVCNLRAVILPTNVVKKEFDFVELQKSGIDLDKQLDWASLRDRIKKFSIRNLLLVGPMPTASTSQCVKMGFSEGLFPDESNITLRETTRKSFIYIERELAKMLIERDLWSKGLIRQIQENRGSIQSIELFSDDMRQVYRTAFEQINKFIFESHENNNLQYQLLVSPIGDHTPLTLNGKKIEKAIKTSDGFDISIEVDLGTLCAADTDGSCQMNCTSSIN
ncbi:ribonucleotide reductase [Gigaspora rosea]|uniref:Ribonucleotide reductase n=1 Tax=Gigaspora rosea TaxID=44941 RepID=A0A397UFK0_9GLOM|nr:ribonucleotide reductase [Gigaspora rosea]